MKTALIVGAGIVGLSTALELASRGVEVTVLERGEAMREASWAAAGMLAAADPENPPQLARLARKSLALYPDYLRNIEQLSGHNVPLRTASTLQLCSPGHADSAGHIDVAEAQRRVPGLNPEVAGPFLWLDEQSLDPRDLCLALPVAVRAAGVRILEHMASRSIYSETNGITVETAQGPLSAECLIVCTGAWSDHLPALHSALVPKKGQMLAVRLTQSPSLSAVLRSPEIYLVPRGDGRIIIGATVEDAGFDRTIHPAATDWLLERAIALWPPTKDAAIEEVWTGLRPGSPDGLPLIGLLAPSTSERGPIGNEETSSNRLWIAAGHYRNGILLAPATARLLADAILDPAVPLPCELSEFRPNRFAPALAGKS